MMFSGLGDESKTNESAGQQLNLGPLNRVMTRFYLVRSKFYVFSHAIL